MIKQLGLIGCGLIGGSFALALKKAGAVSHVRAFSATAQTLELAVRAQVIDEACSSAVDVAVHSDVILIAVPVQAIAACLKQIEPFLKPSCLVMDVGSTKASVVRAAREMLKDKLPQFVPAHPIAGKELSGVAHAQADLFTDRPLILTPMSETARTSVDFAQAIWTRIGSKVHILSADAHDKAFAAVSHLPHFIAFAYMNGLTNQAEHAQFLSIAGTGFQDFSRIAGSEPAVWADIFMANKEHLIEQLRFFKDELSYLERLVSELEEPPLDTQRPQGTALNAKTLISYIERSKAARSPWRLNQ